MAEYFSLEQLTPILNMQMKNVQRLAERGEIPAQRVNGEWRFSRKGVVEWLESRIASMDDAQLVELECTLTRLVAGRAAEEDLPISGLLSLESIHMPVVGRTQSSVIREMVDAAMSTNLLWDPKEMEQAVCEREAMCPTAMDNGVALLHPRHPMVNILGEPFLVFGRSYSGVPFASSSMLTDLFFLICSTNDAQHVRTLAHLSRILNEDGFLPALRELDDPKEVLQLFQDAEAQLR